MLDLMTEIVSGWKIYPERMRANLESTHGAIFSQRAMLALVESGMDRQQAYRIVQHAAHEAWDTGVHLRELLQADEAVRARISDAQLADIFDLTPHLKHIDATFERLGLLPAPVTAD